MSLMEFSNALTLDNNHDNIHLQLSCSMHGSNNSHTQNVEPFGMLEDGLKSDEKGEEHEYCIFKTRSLRSDGCNDSTIVPAHGQMDEALCSDGQQYLIPAERYFDALQGPELESFRDLADMMQLPLDKKWPFLFRFPIGCFGSLGLGSQTMLLKSLATTSSLPVWPLLNLVLWCLAAPLLLITFITYILKCICYFEAVRREYQHPVRINYFFAPWIACMFLALGAPPLFSNSLNHPAIWCVFMAPIFMLELKVYGQWLSGGEGKLSKVANPSTHLTLIGNFVGSILAARVGWTEPALFFWSVGFAHYLVLLVTLYQRLPSAEMLPKELHPIYFLFVAVPSSASVAWAQIAGDFNYMSKFISFVGLFLYSSLVVRFNFFRGFRFSIAWWAFAFPMTSSAIATIHYYQKGKENGCEASLYLKFSGKSKLTLTIKA